MDDIERLKEMAGILDDINRGGFTLVIDDDRVSIDSAELSEPPGPSIDMSIKEFEQLVLQFNQYKNNQHNY